MAAIRISELMRWQADGDREIDPGLARIFVHHFLCLQHGDRRASEWLHTYCPDMPARDREYLISEATNCPLKWSADKLAWKLGLTDADRTRLRITTIGAVDCNREQRKERDRQRRTERERARRAAIRAIRVPTI